LRVMRELKRSTRFQVVPFASQNGILVLEPTGSKRVFQSGRRSDLSFKLRHYPDVPGLANPHGSLASLSPLLR